jgi:hypothetical protein
MTSRKTKRAAEIQELIRQILLLDWDPLNVGTSPGLEDEYDAYIGPIYRVLAENCSEESLIQLLYKLEKDDLGTSLVTPELLRPIARKLLMLDIKL